MTNNYNPSTQENEIERMKQLMGYGLNESKSHDSGNSSVAFHQVGPDGNTYGIIKECNKFYIKVAPKKDTEILAEDYDYIGGFMNKKEYEYPTYTIASKQFGLKMKSLNEAAAEKGKKPVIIDKPQESAEWQVNETKEMRAELNRFNQILNNVDYILSEEKERDGKALQLGSKDVDEEGGNAYQETPDLTKVNNMKENETDPKNADDTYNEKPMTTDQVNKMKENSKDPKNADGTYSKKAPKVNEGRTLKLTNEQAEKVLVWSDDKNYLDTTKGTEIGHDGDPYTDEVKPTNEAVYNSEDMNQHVGDAEGHMEPFDDKVNEEVEIDGETGLPNEDGAAGEMLVDDENDLMPSDYEIEYNDDFEEDVPFEDTEGNFQYDADYGYDHETRDDMSDLLESLVKKVVEETKLDVFGKHPAYQKSPMTTPSNREPSRWGREWDDDSVKGEKPFGTQIGHGGDPYTEKVIDLLTDAVVDQLLKESFDNPMNPTAQENPAAYNTARTADGFDEWFAKWEGSIDPDKAMEIWKSAQANPSRNMYTCEGKKKV